jgi:hypothetical protein
MKSKLESTKRKRLILASVVICAVLIAGSAILWQGGKVSEAALLDAHPGLVGWWRFDEGTGTAANDSSGDGNNGTIYGATWVTGVYGQALSFDGTDDYVDIPASVNLPFSGTNSWTIAMWVNCSAGYWYYPQFCKGTYGNGPGLTICDYDGRIKGGNGTSGFDQYGMWQTDLRGQGWQYTVITYDGSVFRAYLDGQAKGTFTWNGGIGDTSSYDIWLGQFWGPSYNGAIDEVQIYNRALSAAEVQGSFQQRPDSSSNLLAKVPKGTTDFIATLSWQGTASINVTIQSPSQNYTEDMVPVYQKTTYSTTGGTSSMLNIKRVEVSLTTALTSDQNWYVTLTFDNAVDYKITVEVQK